METGKGRSRRQASPRPVPRRASQSIARPYCYRTDLIESVKRTLLSILMLIACASVGMLLAWCLACPDHQPISEAEWRAQLAAQGIGAAE